MLRVPRLALGSVQLQADTQPITWALLELLNRQACQVQHFHARSCYSARDGAITATGLASRHLDSWLMSRTVCGELLVRGLGSADLALVEGRFDRAVIPPSGGSLDRLCDWLDLPRVAVLDVAGLENCALPARPQADALLLDGVSGPAEFFHLQTSLEALWNIPVLGGMERLPLLRAALDSLPAGSALPRELCDQLGEALARYTRTEGLRRLASRRELPDVSAELFRAGPAPEPITIAVAYDEAFHCYFADTLDLLELMGATVIDFSPLHDESLPPETDLIYIGCGHPERFAAGLAENHCMMLALRNHLCAGRRIFADGGGLAYLCQYLESAEGTWLAMAGVLPAIARRRAVLVPPRPVEVTLAGSNWLGESGATLRGYLNSNWLLESNGELSNHLAEAGHEFDLVGRYQALGSRIQLNFATQPGFLRSFLEPSVPAGSLVAAKGIV
jgi:cobyrinic acid a,c-diamide synthase